jgi:hypothetical protein
LQPDDIVTKELIVGRLDVFSENGAHHMETVFNELVANFIGSTKKEPTAKERRMLTALAWTMVVD